MFGDGPTAMRALQRIDRRHGPVRGTAPDGRPYDARDPRLGLWVQSTLVLTSLRLYEAVLGPLGTGDRQRYWDEAKTLARVLGIGDDVPPATVEDLLGYERRMLGTEVIGDVTARAVGRDVLRPPIHLPRNSLLAA